MPALLRDSVYQAIRRAILSCEFKPGQELREIDLAEQYKVSRSPIRDALLRLEQDRLVTVLPRQGYRVNPISISDVEEIFGLRLHIEPACAAAAAQASDSAVRILDPFSGFTGVETYDGANLDHNRALHLAIADLADNRRLAAIEQMLIEEFYRLIRLSFSPYDERDIGSTCQQHQGIIDAIQAHDAETAHRLAAHHVRFGQSRVMETLNLQAVSQSRP
jgi:DNA-binding GntR family transcriptional regulator